MKMNHLSSGWNWKTIIPRGIKRLRARWRLHQIEWNIKYSPLQPPEGYEKYYEDASIYKPIRDLVSGSWREIFDSLRKSWWLYRLTHRSDFEEIITRLHQNKMLEREAQQRGVTVDELRHAKMATQGFVQDMAEEAVKFTLEKTAREDTSKMATEKMSLFQNCIQEVSEGYKEVLEGRHEGFFEFSDDVDENKNDEFDLENEFPRAPKDAGEKHQDIEQKTRL